MSYAAVTRRHFIRLGAIAPLAGALLAKAHAQTLGGEIGPGLASLDAFLAGFARDNRLRGAALVILKQDRLVYARSLGYVLSKGSRLLQPDTLVPIGSVTKFLTALGVMKVMQDGRLELDAPFMSCLPTALIGGINPADERWRQITVRQLLQMCAGIPQDMGQVWKFRAQIKSRRDFYSLVLSRRLEYEPDTKQAYNNCNFAILGDVIEAATGRAWRTFVLEEILQPIGIERLPAYEEIRYTEASPNDWDSGAAGVACMSLLDLARLVCEFSKPESDFRLNLQSRSRMLQPPPPPLRRRPDGTVEQGFYGLGLTGVSWEDGKAAFSHGGALDNAHTFFVRHTDGSIYVGFYCGELAGDHTGSGQWTMCGDLLKVAARIPHWPSGREF